MELSGQQRKNLQQALLDAFPSKSLLEQMLSFELNKNLNVIVEGGSLQNIVFQLITTAESEGWVQDLVRAARKSNPGNSNLKNIAEELLSKATSLGTSSKVQEVNKGDSKIKYEKFNFEHIGSFVTSHSNHQVNLQVICSGEIKYFMRIEDFSNEVENIDDLIQQKVVALVSQFLCNIEPKRFYLNFYSNPNNGLSVESELKERINIFLTQEFRTSKINIILNPFDDELITSFAKLYGQLCNFEIEIFPLFNPRESIILSGQFKVEAIAEEKFYIFQYSSHDIQTIKNFLEDELRSKLITFPHEVLAYTTLEQQSILEKNIQTLARTAIVERFGLEINVRNLFNKQL
ncbi:hypothetical protein RIVM261_075960 [Rivularia sp. IAM M-261]|nr:hypothetical protein RIVM261_075960 [Rivularia sp. IAM M-261]